MAGLFVGVLLGNLKGFRSLGTLRENKMHIWVPFSCTQKTLKVKFCLWFRTSW
jgi:hypothetical protein